MEDIKIGDLSEVEIKEHESLVKWANKLEEEIVEISLTRNAFWEMIRRNHNIYMTGGTMFLKEKCLYKKSAS